MILLHHPEVELSRALLATMPEHCDLVDWTSGMARAYYADEVRGPEPSAFPSVIVDVPAYAEDRPLFGEGGEFLGMARVNVPARQEALRMPASWDAVQSYVAVVEDRARLQPAP